MCGIIGAVSLKGNKIPNELSFKIGLDSLGKRGPDAQQFFTDDKVKLGHTRLAIQDLRNQGNQPFWDQKKRFCIIYNGEVYNFKKLRRELQSQGYKFRSSTDTEVLLNLYIEHGKKCLGMLDGLYSFAIYDSQKKTIFIARDRFGIKPLVYSIQNGVFLFSSEMKGLIPLLGRREIDKVSLYHYLQFTYIPAPSSIFENVKKLLPGHSIFIEEEKVTIEKYYELNWNPEKYIEVSYENQKEKLLNLLEKSVQNRLISDAPLGAFLSGGIDSSAIVSLASKHVSQLKTFSIGFKGNQFLDETNYASYVAKKFKTDHKVIKIDERDYLKNLDAMLDYIDEPFADSSALAVFILSKYVRNHVKVALSGDGADEIFAGYNRYKAEYFLQSKPLAKSLLKILAPWTGLLPQSRDFKISNFGRQLRRLARGAQLEDKERYLHWCRFVEKERVLRALSPSFRQDINEETFLERSFGLTPTKSKKDFNQILYNDVHNILPNDMLTKVDLMSMANSLEVRVPFLNHDVVEFAFSLRTESKINGSMKKKVLQDSFKQILPKELYNRPKQGFSIPLNNWYRNELWDIIDKDYLSEEKIKNQNIFDYNYIGNLKNQIRTGKKADNEAHIWSLIVFQHWYGKNFEY